MKKCITWHSRWNPSTAARTVATYNASKNAKLKLNAMHCLEYIDNVFPSHSGLTVFYQKQWT